MFKSFIPKRISNRIVLGVYDLFSKLSKVSNRVIAAHKEANRAVLLDAGKSPLKEGSGFIENQSEWTDVQIGKGKNPTMQHAGCGIFAVYNALFALQEETGAETLLELIARFEKKGLALKGRLGISPKAIYQYFKEAGFEVHLTLNKDTETINQMGVNYDVTIVTAYNDQTDIMQQIHTVCITKNERDEFFVHNTCHRKGSKYVAMPAGEKGFDTLQETISKFAKNPLVICIIGINKRYQ